MKSRTLSRMLSKEVVFMPLCWAVDCTKQAIVQDGGQYLERNETLIKRYKRFVAKRGSK